MKNLPNLKGKDPFRINICRLEGSNLLDILCRFLFFGRIVYIFQFFESIFNSLERRGRHSSLEGIHRFCFFLLVFGFREYFLHRFHMLWHLYRLCIWNLCRGYRVLWILYRRSNFGKDRRIIILGFWIFGLGLLMNLCILCNFREMHRYYK